jgi:uncharacterized protein (DUF4415 family)
MKRSSASSLRAKRLRTKDKAMRTSKRRLDNQIKALLRLPDEKIDTSDIPKVTDWSKGVVGKFYRPLKEPVTIRLDADILAWLKAQGPGYQTRINSLLRDALRRHAKSRSGRL